jgi:hypothetical protein
MTRPRSFILRNALAAMSVRLVAMQVALALLVAALALLWLRLPDSTALHLVATILLGLLLLAVAGGGEAALMLRLCGQPRTRSRMLKATFLLLAAAALWLGWIALIGHFQSSDMVLAGYLNSRFPASLRNSFSYPHLYQGLEWIASTLQWIGAGILLVFASSAAASARPASASKLAFLSPAFWATLLASSLAAPALTSLLMQWTPGHALGIEAISLAVRLGLAITLDAAIAVFILAVVAACIVYSDSHATPAGSPATSQPRTAETP